MAVTLVRTGKKVTLVGRDGQKLIYELVRGYTTIEHTTLDLDILKSELQKGFADEGIDGTVEAVKHVREKNYDYVLCDSWVAAESPIAPVIVLAILVIIKFAVIAAAIIVPAIIVSNIIRNLTTREFHCPHCGEGLPDLPSLDAHVKTAHPEAPPYTCPHCGQGFSTALERDKHAAECLWTPPAVPGWIPWVFGGIAITAIAVFVVPRVIRR